MLTPNVEKTERFAESMHIFTYSCFLPSERASLYAVNLIIGGEPQYMQRISVYAVNISICNEHQYRRQASI